MGRQVTQGLESSGHLCARYRKSLTSPATCRCVLGHAVTFTQPEILERSPHTSLGSPSHPRGSRRCYAGGHHFSKSYLTFLVHELETMANQNGKKGCIGILTGGGDVPG